MEELKIIVSQQSGVINTNFATIKENISVQMDVYKELEVTEQNKVERKKDIATLRKISKAVNDEKIKQKNEFMKPYLDFESQVKELIEIINEPISVLDSKVKEFEEKQRLEKIDYIKTTFTSLARELSEKISLDRIYDNKWENASISKKAVKDEITTKINDIRQSISVISGMQSDKTEEALEMFYDGVDLPAVIGFINRYEQQKREIEARMEAQKKVDQERALEAERERIREEERKRIREEERIKEEAKRQAYEEQQSEIQAEKDAMAVQRNESASLMQVTRFSVNATPEEIAQIEMYLNSLGVEYERTDM